jgi:hypothetical protein
MSPHAPIPPKSLPENMNALSRWRYTLGTRTPYRYTNAPAPTVASAVSDARGCQITP